MSVRECQLDSFLYGSENRIRKYQISGNMSVGLKMSDNESLSHTFSESEGDSLRNIFCTSILALQPFPTKYSSQGEENHNVETGRKCLKLGCTMVLP